MSRVIVATMLCAALAGCAAPLPDRFPPTPDAPDNHTLWVVSRGLHAGVIVAAADARPLIPALRSIAPDARYLEIGWGDEGYYTSRTNGNSAGLALEAMFASRGTVVLVVATARPPPEEFPQAQIEELVVSNAGFRAMAARIDAAFRRDATGNPIPRGPGRYRDSRFYAATGHYWFLHTCVNWTAELMREMGCPITPALALTAGNTLRKARRDCRVT